MKITRTQVGIIGAGPAGLFLAHLLHLNGIESVVLESRSREYVESRVRAGVLEQGTVDLMCNMGVGDRLKREGLVHRGIELCFNRRRHRIDFEALTGRTITIYAQHEVIIDLIAAHTKSGSQLLFEAEAVAVEGIDSDQPRIRFYHEGQEQQVVCDFVVGCDGFRGMARDALPSGFLNVYQRIYPFAWLGILAGVAPASKELIYASHESGFALLSMRTPSVSRLYLQVDHNEDIANWPDDRVWEQLRLRLDSEDFELRDGPVLQKSITPMRSFVAEPMQYNRIFLAGDAAHIVPPTGAKGLNLAVRDTRILASGLSEYYTADKSELLERYSKICLRNAWQAQRFCWWMTQLLHRVPGCAFDHRRQTAELEYLISSPAASTMLAENYVGAF